MKIVIFSHDLPWPAIHGGRIDSYNRLRAFKELNHKIFFVCWSLLDEDKSEGAGFNHIKSVTDELVCFPRKNTFSNKIAKFLKLAYQPNLVTQCSLSKKSFLKLSDQLKSFEPDIIFIENIYAAKLAYKFAAFMNLPVFIRSHNIEHIYIKKMANLSKSLKVKFKFLAMRANLKKYEMLMLRKADAYFDISLQDLLYWKQKGIKKGYWMPPVFYKNINNNSISESNFIRYDIAYIGNLNSPNNIHGLFWFFEKIFPIIEKVKENVTVLIAGSNVAHHLSSYCLRKKNITLLSDPTNIYDLYKHSKVLINPLCFGSGVNIKTVEMLHLDKPVVCTPKAIEGLPKEMESIFEIAEQPQDFALKILQHLIPPDIHLTSRVEVKDYFKPQFLISNLQIMEKIGIDRKLEKI